MSTRTIKKRKRAARGGSLGRLLKKKTGNFDYVCVRVSLEWLPATTGELTDLLVNLPINHQEMGCGHWKQKRPLRENYLSAFFSSHVFPREEKRVKTSNRVDHF